MDQRAGLAPRQDPGGRCGDLVASSAGCAAAAPAGLAGEQGAALPPTRPGPQGWREAHYLFGGFCQRQVRCLERARRTRSAAGVSPVGAPRLAAPSPLLVQCFLGRAPRPRPALLPLLLPPPPKGFSVPAPSLHVCGGAPRLFTARWRPPSSPRSECRGLRSSAPSCPAPPS